MTMKTWQLKIYEWVKLLSRVGLFVTPWTVAYQTPQNLWDAAKAVLRGKIIAIQSYLKKQEKHQIDNLTLHLKQLEKEDEQQQQQNFKLVEGKKS